ncbi:hypothetical protein BH11ACT2_BH11ACT2_12750 [soil metagenome]
MVLISPSHSRNSTVASTDISLIGEDLYSVLTATDTLGYVHKVGNVFVALRGHDFGHAVEVGQTLSWERAIDMVRSA